MAQDSDPSINKQKSNKNLDFYFFVTSFWLFFFTGWCKCTFKKYWAKKLFFCWNLDTHWQKRKIRIRIRIWNVSQWYECHGFTTPLPTLAAVTQNQSRVNTPVNPCRLSGYGALPLYTIVNTQFLIIRKCLIQFLSLAIHKPSTHSQRVKLVTNCGGGGR
jgi:hypothetical protein